MLLTIFLTCYIIVLVSVLLKVLILPFKIQLSGITLVAPVPPLKLVTTKLTIFLESILSDIIDCNSLIIYEAVVMGFYVNYGILA